MITEFTAPLLASPTGGAVILTCIDCGGARSDRSKSGRCFSCAMNARKPAPRYCSDCGASVNRQSKLRLCRKCLYKSPEYQRRRTDAVRRAFECPKHRAKMAKVMIRNHQKAMLDPKFRQWQRENGKRLAVILQSPEIKAITNSPEVRARRGRGVSEARMGWCPPELRDEYRRLIRSKRLHSADARAIIELKMIELRAVKHPDFSSVIDFMRRLTAIIRLDNGNYRVGTAELTPGQLLERAEGKGYELPRWAA